MIKETLIEKVIIAIMMVGVMVMVCFMPDIFR
jgi:hypothetical protein